VYDGHGGTQNCNFLKEELHKYMLKDINLREPEAYIRKALNTLDDDFMYKSKK
jgi:serine/threonine protein phosphatase PrpC